MFSAQNNNNYYPMFESTNSGSCYVASSNSKERFRESKQSEARWNKLNRIRFVSCAGLIDYVGIKYQMFVQRVQQCNNPYSLLLTLFSIIDQFSWRQYLSHLCILIKKLNNIFQQSKGDFFSELSRDRTNNYNFDSSFSLNNFQQKIQKMLYLSDKQLQEHLLIFVHCLIAYNSIYRLVDEFSFSAHLLHKHSYEKAIRQEIFWILAVMTVSDVAVIKILKVYQISEAKQNIILPILTILSNFIAEAPEAVVQQLIGNNQFQNIVCDGLTCKIYAIEREAVLLCNNILHKNPNCQNFLLSQINVIEMIRNLQNEQSENFKFFLQNIKSNQTNIIFGNNF